MAELNEPDAQHDVATFTDGESSVNTIVLSGRDVVIPLEMDLDGDPLQDDEVRLRSMGGAVDRALSPDHDDVEGDEEARAMRYTFRDVPYGAYRVTVRIGEEWSDLHRDLVVRMKKVSLGGKPITEPEWKKKFAPPIAQEPQEEGQEGEEEQPLEYVDQVEG